ncbi:MAG: hypothetical protein AAGG08_05315, partial [Actinomycetota bacterium]
MSDGANLDLDWFPEPLLGFGGGGLHVDPKEGIARFGPNTHQTPSHPGAIRIGIISTAELQSQTADWLRTQAEGVAGDEKNPRFPGFRSDRGFMSELTLADDWNATFTSRDVSEVMDIRSQRDRFEAALNLLLSKLALVAERDRIPDCV